MWGKICVCGADFSRPPTVRRAKDFRLRRDRCSSALWLTRKAKDLRKRSRSPWGTRVFSAVISPILAPLADIVVTRPRYRVPILAAPRMILAVLRRPRGLFCATPPIFALLGQLILSRLSSPEALWVPTLIVEQSCLPATPPILAQLILGHATTASGEFSPAAH